MEKIESFNVLPETEYEIAKMLHQKGISLGCKIVFKTRALKNQPIRYRVTFNKQKNNKILFWMEVIDGTLLVKANLFHIHDYEEKVSDCSESIKNSIIKTQECKKCETCNSDYKRCGCPKNASYFIDGVRYTPCYFHGHFFQNLTIEDWYVLIDLLSFENDII